MSLFSCNLSLIQTPFQLNTEFVSDSLLIHTTMDSLSKRWVETVKSPHIYTVQKKKNLNSNWQSLTCTEKPLVLQFSLKLNPKKRRSRLSTHPIYWRTQIRGERSKRTGFKNRIRQKRSGEGWKIVKKKRNSSFWGSCGHKKAWESFDTALYYYRVWLGVMGQHSVFWWPVVTPCDISGKRRSRGAV